MKEKSRGKEFLYAVWTNNLGRMSNNLSEWKNVEGNGLMGEGEEIKEKRSEKKVKTKSIITEKRKDGKSLKKRFKVC